MSEQETDDWWVSYDIAVLRQKLAVAERELGECRRACERFAMQVRALAAERDEAESALAILDEIMPAVYAERDAAIALLRKARLHVSLTTVADEIDAFLAKHPEAK